MDAKCLALGHYVAAVWFLPTLAMANISTNALPRVLYQLSHYCSHARPTRLKLNEMSLLIDLFINADVLNTYWYLISNLGRYVRISVGVLNH